MPENMGNVAIFNVVLDYGILFSIVLLMCLLKGAAVEFFKKAVDPDI